MWDRLGRVEVDLLVVGGGINGAGIARDAARRGLSVALVDMSDLASGTSSRSSKLIHGGLRYLEQYEIALVFESVSERRVLMDLAPHLVHPLGFLFPVYAKGKHSLRMIQAGMWVYDGLSLFRSPKRHRTLSVEDLAREEPALQRDGLLGAPLYFDCSTDDARLTLETAVDAARSGAVVATWAQVEQFVIEEGRVRGAVVRDVLGGRERTVRARAVVNATGPWTDRTRNLPRPGLEAPAPRPMLRTTKGVHIVVDHERLPLTHAVVCNHPADGRVLFAIPWGDRTYVGTTDTDDAGDPSMVHATRADVDYLIDAATAYFPSFPLTRADVLSTWAGLRPLVDEGADGHASDVSREHKIAVAAEGLITIAGGKLTTYRRMSAEVVDTAVRYLQMSGVRTLELTPAGTDHAALPGAEGWPADDDVGRVAAAVVERGGGTLDDAQGHALASAYGTRALEIASLCRTDASLAERLVPDRPDVLAQVDFAVRDEFAATVCDVLIRRTQMFFKDRDQGLGCLERVAGRMAQLLRWPDTVRAREVERYQAEVALSRRWRQD